MNPLENGNLEDSDGDIELKKDNVDKELKARKSYTRKGPHVMTEARQASFDKAKQTRDANIAKRKAEIEKEALIKKDEQQKKLLETAEKIKKTKKKTEQLLSEIAEPVRRKQKKVLLVEDSSSEDEIEIVRKPKKVEPVQQPVQQPQLPPKKKINFV